MKQNVLGLVGLGLLAVLFAVPARAEEVKAGDLVITQAWSRATPGGAKVGGGYLCAGNATVIAGGRGSPARQCCRL